MITTATTMRAVTTHRFGLDSLTEETVDIPTLGPEQVLVRVGATSVNPVDYHMLTGTPWFARIQFGLRRPKQAVLGVDLAGTVEAVGDAVTKWRPGDQVMGSAPGTLAEYAVTKETSLVARPDNVTVEQAGAVGVAALTALQALRDKAHVAAGTRVLINGAAGGVGTFAVQIAKALGAHVTGVCSTRNVELVRSLGADVVVDYTSDDVVARGERYDAMIDNVGNRSLSDCRRLLEPTGTYVAVSGPKKNRLLGPIPRMVGGGIRFKFGSQKFAGILTKMTPEDLAAITAMCASGTVTPVVDRTFALADVRDAFELLGTGHARAKLVIVP